jgi:tripartite-type tricarboxylate transporter receptor subunit TctC
MMTTMTQTLVCNPGLGVKTLADFARQVGAGTVRSYGSGGAGSPGHLAMELFTSRASLKLQHVPYKGPAPALQDIIGGQVDCGFLAGPTVLPHVKTGRLTAVAVSGLKRSPTLPDVPTVSESGYPNYDANSVLVLFAPQKTPHAVVAAFRGAVVDALKSPAIEQMIRQSDQAVVANTPSEAAAELAKISQKWQQVVQRIKLQVD